MPLSSRRRSSPEPAETPDIGQEAIEKEDDDTPRPPATFEGRLELKDFIFKPVSEPGSRRSPRRATPATSTTTGAVSASPSPRPTSQSPAKRKHPTASPTPSSSSSKKRTRKSSGYAPPSTYAHLPPLPDVIAQNLLVLFVGLNPGIQTARSGHAYAHPSNLFWKLLYSSGLTTRQCRPEEDRQLPELFSLGNTNIVARPSRNGSELSKKEMDEGVEILEAKARQWRPETMCIVGKSIWESIWRVRHGRSVGKDFKYGWQDETENMGVTHGLGNDRWAGAKVFVASSTSGLAAALSPAEKQAIWAELGSWAKLRRAERELESDA